MQKVRRHTLPLRAIVLRPLVSVWFQVLLTQLIAVLFTVQSPYLFTIGHRVVFSLARWSGRVHTEFHELRATLERLSTPISPFAYGTFTLFGLTFQTVSLGYFSSRRPQPQDESWFGLFRFRSPLLTEYMSVSFPAGTKMFQFPAFALPTLYIRIGVMGGYPIEFPHSEISGSTLVCQLPEAYRRLPRLSSPLDAKASTIHP